MSELTRYGVPRSLAPFLQEYAIDDLAPEEGRYTLIERMLRYGNRAETRWLFHHYGMARRPSRNGCGVGESGRCLARTWPSGAWC